MPPVPRVAVSHVAVPRVAVPHALVIAAAIFAAGCGSIGNDDLAGNETTTETKTSAPEETAESNDQPAGEAEEPNDDEQTTTTDRPEGTPPTEDADSSQTPVEDEPSTTESPELVDVYAPLPTTAMAMAAELDQFESLVRDATRSDSEVAPAGERLQRLYRLLSQRNEWIDEVANMVDADIEPDVRQNVEARTELNALLGTGPASDQLPAWRIREPRPAAELLAYYREAEAATGVPWTVLAAINLVETRMGRIEGLSTAGAVGPMQFLPTTWNECCEGDPRVDRDAILGAGTYLRQRGAATDLPRAIHGYNNSDHYVAAVLAYAEVMNRDPSTYRAYHAYQVYFASSVGVLRLPVGYEEAQPVDAAAWLADHPDALAGD